MSIETQQAMVDIEKIVGGRPPTAPIRDRLEIDEFFGQLRDLIEIYQAGNTAQRKIMCWWGRLLVRPKTKLFAAYCLVTVAAMLALVATRPLPPEIVLGIGVMLGVMLIVLVWLFFISH